MGERKDRVSSKGSSVSLGPGISYVRFVVEASNFAPRYVGKETLKLGDCQNLQVSRMS